MKKALFERRYYMLIPAEPDQIHSLMSLRTFKIVFK